jgi:hypothetical protein
VDLASDPRISELTKKIQAEPDPNKLIALVTELTALLDTPECDGASGGRRQKEPT